MRYIKKFESKTISFSKRLRKFTERYLSFMLDMGVSIQIESSDCYSLFIQDFKNGFNWQDIKYDFIPFIQMLKNEYDIVGKIRFGFRYKDKYVPARWYSTNELINDEIDPTFKIITISIDLKEKDSI